MKDDTAEVLSIEGREVWVTHPDKPYFSKQTKLSKLDLVRYYLSVAPGALGGIRDRSAGSQALRRRRRRPAVLSETRARQAAFVVANRYAVIPFGPQSGGGRCR